MKIANVMIGLVAGVFVSAVGIAMKMPQAVVYVVSAAVTAGIVATLNRR